MSRTTSIMCPEHFRCSLNARIAWGLLFSLLVVQAASAQNVRSTRKSTEEIFAGKTAWQLDEGLGKKWEEVTGRFIFQRTCLSCHDQGPAACSKSEWTEKLKDFPDEVHAELLPKEFGDLTAMFSYGHMMASDLARYQSLQAFLLSAAPDRVMVESQEESKDTVDLFPAIGQAAPEFSIVDTDGEAHTLTGYIQDNKALILVLSRAHW